MDLNRFFSDCKAMGLDAASVEKHRLRLKRFFSDDFNPFLKIKDTCRKDNLALVDLQEVEIGEYESCSIFGFVPSAGASSRYFACLNELRRYVYNEDFEAALGEVEKLKLQGIDECYLLEGISALLSASTISMELRDRFLTSLSLPKALQKCAQDENFLQRKLKEHRSYNFVEKSCFVVNPRFDDDFNNFIKADETAFALHQGPKLSTVRFGEGAEPVYSDGSPSTVPAGHGTLVEVLAELKSRNPEAQVAFIRNIDNTPELNADTIQATNHAAKYFKYLYSCIQKIRQFLDGNLAEKAENIALQLLQAHNIKGVDAPLWDLLRLLFHRSEKDLANATEPKDLLALYKQPLNLLGQVPNLGKDIGGCPVFVEVDGEAVKLCIELPHVSPEDKRNFLEDHSKMTHFNPVFVFTELTDNPQLYQADQSPFWIVAKKQFESQTVYYHETVLYELLGNSSFSNTIFCEIPRSLFVPNKTIFDSKAR